jgi:hypothetical protein
VRTIAEIRWNAAALELQDVFARLLDVALIILGAVAASFCGSGGTQRVAVDQTLGVTGWEQESGFLMGGSR